MIIDREIGGKYLMSWSDAETYVLELQGRVKALEAAGAKLRDFAYDSGYVDSAVTEWDAAVKGNK